MQKRKSKDSAAGDDELEPPPNIVNSKTDALVALVIEAKSTHNFLGKLHISILSLWVLFGLFHYHPSFSNRWRGQTLGVLDTANLLQNLWGIVFLILLALRRDFPFNLFATLLAAFYAGIVFGLHLNRSINHTTT